MSGSLVSPGVSVTVTNESFYTSSPTGTVPLIVIATAQDKLQPGSTAIATATTKATANQLQLVTSQRDSLLMFGAPTFYSVGGTPEHDNELNEVGAFTVYEFLGVANNAYVIRADIDLKQLAPSSVPPTGTPTNGSYWLDTSKSTWGLFTSNGDDNPAYTWQAQTPIVINSSSMLEKVVQGHAVPKITSASASNVCASGGNLYINGVPIAIATSDTITDISTKINTNQQLQLIGITSAIFARNEPFSPIDSMDNTMVTAYNLRIKSSNLDNKIVLSGTSSNDILTGLGFSNDVPENIDVPLNTVGTTGSLAVDTLSTESDNSGNLFNRVFQRITVTSGFGLAETNQDWWFAVGSTDTTYVDEESTDKVFAGWGWQEARPVAVVGSKSAPTFVGGANALISIGNAAPITVTATGGTLSGLVANINAEFSAAQLNANAAIVTSGTSSYVQVTNYDGSSIWLHDTSNVAPVWRTAGVSTSQTYFGGVTGNVATFNGGDEFSISIGGLPASTITVPNSPNNTLGNVVALINSAVKATVASEVGSALSISYPGSYITLDEVIGEPLNNNGIPVGYTYGPEAVYQDYYPALAVPSKLSQMASDSVWVNTTPQNRGASVIVNQYVNGTWVPMNGTPNTGTIPWYSSESVANTAFGSSRSVGSIFMNYGVDSPGSEIVTAQLLRWSGSSWDQLVYTPSATAPQGPPASGALWYNSNLRVDIMVNAGSQWLGYKNLYPATDPNGVIIQATPPITQSNGNGLVDYDIWLNSSEANSSYPTLSRYVSSSATWVQIDNTDHISPAGILFADARSADIYGNTTSSAMVISNNVDFDVPRAVLYPTGLLLFNTRYSTNNVKKWTPNYISNGVGAWVTVSGNREDGSPYMGSAAQRNMIVQAMKSVIASNQDARADSTYFNLVATPGYTECISDMVALNVDKQQIAFVVGDTPGTLPPDGTSIQNWATNAANVVEDNAQGLITHDYYTGLWYPWGLGTNLDGSSVFIPPSLMALMTIAFNDQVAYPWFAPAGFNRGLVTAATSVGYLTSTGTYTPLSLNQGQRDVMYENEINPIAYIPKRGLVIYGQKTLSPDSSALDRINVARLVNYLKYTLDNAAKVFLFEPNDAQTRLAVTGTFQSFFNNLIGLRAIYDFAVVCDTSNNTPATIDANQLWIDIAIKPEKAIEFIYIPIRLLNTGDPMSGGTQAATA